MNTEKITIRSLIEKKERLLKKTKDTKELYVKSLDGIVKIQEPGLGISADIKDMDANFANKYVLYECLIEPNVKAPELQEAFGNPTIAHDVLDYIFKEGEIANLSAECMALAGYGSKGVVDVVKN